MPDPEAIRALIVELDATELACRMAEAFWEVQRPVGDTATQSVDRMGEQGDHWLAAAYVAIAYARERLGFAD